MWRTARVATACTFISGFAWLGFAGEPTAPAVTLPEATAPVAAPPVPPTPVPAPTAEVAPAVAAPAPAAKVRPTVKVLDIGQNTEFEVGIPAGKIHVQMDPGGSRILMTDPRGVTVEMSRPSRQAIAEGAVAPNDPEAPQLKDLLIQSLIQTMANHRKVRVGRTRIHVHGTPKSAPAPSVPETKPELGAPADLEEDTQSAVPVNPRAVEVVRAPSDAQTEAPAAAAPARAVKLQAVQAQALEAVPAQRRIVRIHKLVLPVEHTEDADVAPPAKLTGEKLELRRQEALKAARIEVMRRVQEQAQAEEAVPVQPAPLNVVKPGAVEVAPAEAVAPALRKLEAARIQAVPLQAQAMAPPAALTTRRAVPAAVPGVNDVSDELSVVQKELSALTNELVQLSQKRSVKGRTLQEVVRKIGETNQRLEAVRKKLAQ